MRKDLILDRPIYSSFLTCDKDIEKILKVLFITSKPYSDILKRLLIINNKDCLDISNQQYKEVIDKFSLGDLIEKGYIRFDPKVTRTTHEEVKTYILISLDNFIPNENNNAYLDYDIFFDIMCYNDVQVLDDYQNRSLMICGYIDGILNSLTNFNKNYIKSHQSQIKLSGIGTYNLIGCKRTTLNEEFSIYSLGYSGIHFSEDIKQIGNINNE